MNEKPPSYEQAVLESKKYVKPVLVQPNAGRYVHKIPEEIQPGIPSRQFIIMEKCPACGFGVLKESYSMSGLCWALFCFPCGLICCLASKEKKCVHCAAKYSCNS